MRIASFIITVLLIISGLHAQNRTDSVFGSHKRIYEFRIFEEIAPAATRKTSRAIDEANAMNADLIILHLNTYGGLVSDADSIRTRILNSKIPVYVFIENNAASAGALISIACNRIFMKEGATIGAATVVEGSGAAAPDKYQSYMRSKMRATATARGRSPEIAEAMVDGDKVVPGLNDTGDVVTLTTDEAIQWGFCDGKYASIEDMLKAYGIVDYRMIVQEVGWIDNAIGFLISPGVSGVLVLIILGGLYYEIRTPGIGFPLLASVVAALLYFAPLYLEGLADNWEILIFILGLVLLGLEIFVIPGWGFAGISGLVLMFGSLVLAAVNNIVFDFSASNPEQIHSALLRVVYGVLGFIVFAILSARFFVDSPLFKKIGLEATLQKAEDPVSVDLVGKDGISVTDLKPSGYVEVDGKEYEARSLDGYLPKGQKVKIKKKEAWTLLVEAYNA
ncbi:MAG: nodulation protein NfeD [Bacteroidetes bacterium]|nr:nodulation protein NfeD [Bacteroidota bacterium]